MAQQLDDGEFWLPLEFLTDDDLLMDFKKTSGLFSQTGFNSDLSSPVESVFGSNETESDEDDFITGLTRRLNNSTLSSEHTPKGQKLSSSPQSTLYGCKPESARSSPNCVSSPPDSKDSVGLDFLYAAAEEAARQRIIDETATFYSNSVYGPTTLKPSHIPGPVKSPNQFYPNQAHVQAQARYSYQQLQYQLMMQQRRNVGGTTAWPTLQQSQQMQPPRQRNGTGMRAVFLGETGARKERTGTGVFLPRRFDNNVPKKQGCSVLLPEKVVHALNLNLDSIDTKKDYRNVAADFPVGFHHQNNNVKIGQQMPSLRPQQQQVVKQDLGLPQEWTY